MYAPQSSIDPSLAALLQTAQMVTPDQTPTVAAQVAQAAQQKMQTQGIMQGMQGAKQDYAAAQPSMMRNMQQQQVQQMMQQAMQPKPAGIEGLPAQNMQGMQGMAGGGVVGYAGPDGSKVEAQVAQILQKSPAARSPEENAILRAAGVQVEQRQAGEKSAVTALDKYLSSPFIREAITGGANQLSNEELLNRRDVGGITESIFRALGGNQTAAESQPQAMRPEDAFATPRIDQPQRPVTPPAPPMGPQAQAATQRQGPRGQPSAPPPRPAAPPAAERTQAAGIAQLVAPTMDRSRVDLAGQEYASEADKQGAALRKIASDREAAIKDMPDLNEQGIAALRRAEAERRRLLGIDQSDDSRRRWAGIFRGWGGDRDAYDRILTGIASRDSLANQAQLVSDQAEIKLREAQQAKALGQFDRAKALELEVAELKNKARDDMLKARQIEASLASNEYSTKANIYGTNVSSRDRAADRAAQAAVRNLPSFEQQMAERVIKDYMAKNPGSTLSDAWDFYRGAGKGLDQRASATEEANRIKKQKLLADDPIYKLARFEFFQATDPAKKADAQRRMKEIERAAGIVDGAASPAPSQAAPPVGTVMQGYRFNGGNPADRNNWEKV